MLESKALNILLIEDNPADARLVVLALSDVEGTRYDVRHAERLSQALAVADENHFDAILLDLSLPDSHGLETLARFKQEFPAIPIIVLSGQQEEQIAFEAVKVGAQDYLVKGLESSYLISRAIRYAIERKHNEEVLRQARDDLERRVDERTAELLQANEQLRAQIIERQQAEQALRQSEHQIRLITDALPVLISYVDAQQRFQFNNKAFENWFGHGADQVRGSHLKDIIGNETYRKIHTFIETALSGTETNFEIDVSHPADGLCYIEVVFVPDQNEQGQNKGFFVLIQNITSRKQAEEKERQHLLQMAHISRLNTTNQMATEIAHEINQPLTAIASYSDTCMRLLNADNCENGDVLGALAQISSQAERAGEVIRQLKNFVRKEDTHRSTVDINLVVREMVRLIEMEARWHNVELQLHLADVLPSVLANRILIQQVLLNFVRNAFEAMSDSGPGPHQLIIRTVVNGDNAVEVAVQDNGPGLPADQIGQVFEAFYTTKDEGVGMGLAISDSIIKAHLGSVWAMNNPTGGCTFAFLLPLDDRRM